MRSTVALCLVTLIGCGGPRPAGSPDAGVEHAGVDAGPDGPPPRTGRVGTLTGTFEAGYVDGS